MILKSILLKNFRQFYGDQRIDISPPGNNGVTLIHAENSIGKTTLLNAILWCFFEKTTKKFENQNQIINFTAKNEGKAAIVEVYFIHDGKEYCAQRHTNESGRGAVKFSVVKIENGAFSEPLPNPDAFINTVMPKDMAQYFFFDGEQAENYASQSKKEISNAIRNVLGSSFVLEAINDLKNIERQYSDELVTLPGQDEINDVEKNIERCEQQIEVLQGTLDGIISNIGSDKEQLTNIESLLESAKETEKLQNQRKSAEKELENLKIRREEEYGNLHRWIGTRSLSLIAGKLANQSLEFINNEDLRGKIPFPYNEDFVNGILQSKICICDRHLKPATPEWNAVQRLLTGAANTEVLQKVVRARSRLTILQESAIDAPGAYVSCKQKIAQVELEIQTKEKIIKQLDELLVNSSDPEVQQREKSRKELKNRIEQALFNRGKTERDIEVAKSELRGLNSRLQDLAENNMEAAKILLRKNIATRGISLLSAIQKTQEGLARAEIQSAVNKILEQTARKEYQVEISESFDIKLNWNGNYNTPRSGGENQLLSLAFFASLIQYAKKRTDQVDDGPYIPAVVAPLVLDSPFGQLDTTYKLETAKFIVSMAPQVVLLVSSSQGADVVEAIRSSVGQEYVLVGHSMGKRGDKPEDILTINGKSIVTSLYECERDQTEIREVI